MNDKFKMFKILIKKIISRLKNLINRISLFFLKEKLKKFKSNPKINSVKYLNLIFEYFSSQHQNQYVALGYIRKKMKTKELKINYNLIDYLLPKKQMSLPDFFKNKINCFNVDECLGIGDFKIQQKYDETINSLVNRSNDFDCNYFISLISKKKPFHYLKYTHNFWDDLTRFAIKEYSLKNGREFLMRGGPLMYYQFYDHFMEIFFQLVNSEEFINLVRNKNIYFCPTTSNGSIGSKIEFKIMGELSNKNILFNYSQIMIINEFSKLKEITSSNIFKKIICIDHYRKKFLSLIKKYDLILICNHRAASKISKIYPNFKNIYCLPDHLQDMKHHINPKDFAKDVCRSVLNRGNKRSTLILSQASLLSTFISYEILNNYKEEKISLIDVGKPLETLFLPEITGGGRWRDNEKIIHIFQKMSHLISDDLFDELIKDTKIEVGNKKLQTNMDIEAIDISR